MKKINNVNDNRDIEEIIGNASRQGKNGNMVVQEFDFSNVKAPFAIFEMEVANAFGILREQTFPIDRVIMEIETPAHIQTAFKLLEFDITTDKISVAPLWYTSDKEELVKELKYPNIRCFKINKEVKDSEFMVWFNRDFVEDDYELLTSFLTDYFGYYLGLQPDEITVNLYDSGYRHRITESCPLNGPCDFSLQNVRIVVHGELEDKVKRNPHFHVVSEEFDYDVLIDGIEELKLLSFPYGDPVWDSMSELRSELRAWLGLQSFEIPGFTNEEVIRFCWNNLNPDTRVECKLKGV